MFGKKEFVTNGFFIFLLVGWVVVVSMVTNHWRFGLSPDSCGYINLGINIADGQGYVHTAQHPNQFDTKHSWTRQPPLYSGMIGLCRFAGLGARESAWGISFCAMAGCVVLIYLIGLRLADRITALWAGFFLASTAAFVNKGFWAWTETPFTFFVLLGIWFYLCYKSDIRTRRGFVFLLLCMLCLMLSFYTRYIGIFCIVPFGVDLLIDTLKKRIRFRGLAAAFAVVVLLSLPLFIRNYHVTGHALGSERAASTDTFSTVISQAISGITGVFFGGVYRWPAWKGSGALYGGIGVVILVLVLIVYLYLNTRSSRYGFILGLVLVMFVASVVLRSMTLFDPLDAHGSRLLIYLVPLLGLFLALGVRRLQIVSAMPTPSRFRTLLTTAFAVSFYLVFQAAYASGLAADYARDAIVPAPESMAWVKAHIPARSQILGNYNVLQINAETNVYPVRLLPSAKGGWQQEQFHEVLADVGSCWLVFMWHPDKPINQQVQYGAYILDLLRRRENQEFVLAATCRDGVIFRSRQAASTGH